MAMTLMEAHTVVADPHGDRAWADDKFATQLDLTEAVAAIRAGTAVTGSRTDGSALASLLTALAGLGLIVDESSA